MDFINHFNLIRFKVEHIFLVGTTFINVIILFDLLQLYLEICTSSYLGKSTI